MESAGGQNILLHIDSICRRRSVQIPGTQLDSDVKSGVVSISNALEQTGTAKMIRTIRKLARRRKQAAMQK